MAIRRVVARVAALSPPTRRLRRFSPSRGWRASRRTLPGLGAGDLLGPWRLEELIGEGGISVVFRAARADGAFTRRVAIKVLKFGFQSADERRRLARERRILAALDHPGIARLLDGGTTADGLPWFAVELIEGVDLRQHVHRLQANRGTLAARAGDRHAARPSAGGGSRHAASSTATSSPRT